MNNSGWREAAQPVYSLRAGGAARPAGGRGRTLASLPRGGSDLLSGPDGVAASNARGDPSVLGVSRTRSARYAKVPLAARSATRRRGGHRRVRGGAGAVALAEWVL